MATTYSVAFRKTTPCDPVPVSAGLQHSRRFLIELIGSRPDACALPVAGTTHGRDVFGLLCHLTENSRHAEETLCGVAAPLPGPGADVRAADPSVADPSLPNPSLAHLSVADLLREWQRSGTVVESALHGSRAPAGSVLLTDLFVHELDIRRALGAQEPDYHPAIPTALDVVVGGAGAMVSRLGLPAMRFETSGASWVVGEGEPTATVSAPPVELFNSLTGRRSLRQIRALRWSADPGPRLRVFAWGPFRPLPDPA